MSTLKLHVLSCGHGDTLLLQMPKKKWALVDCHLPGNETRNKFFQYTNSLAINRLDFVVLTHPDSDHYQGMREVLEYFTSSGREVGYFCTAGGSPSHIAKLLESQGVSDADVKEYAALFRTVFQLHAARLLTRHALHDQIATIRISGKRKGFSIVAIGPEYNKLVISEDTDLAGIPHDPLSVNECSVVLVAQLLTRFVSRRIFLPGDMEGDGMSKALSRWDGHPDNVDGNYNFDVIKAPHHGSINGHDVKLSDRIAQKNKSVLVISCGTAYGLPSKTVISDYVDRGWRVYCTSPRQFATQPKNALQATQFGKGKAQPPLTATTHNLIVVAGGVLRFSVTPSAARIHRANLNAYT